MALKITWHSLKTAETPTISAKIPVRSQQNGNRESVAVSGTAAHSAATTENMIARILAGEACGVAVGVGAVATVNNSMPLLAGMVEDIYVPASARISVIAD